MSKVKEKKNTRPQRDEFELEEIAYQLEEANHEKREVVLSVWGRDEVVRGKITKLDPYTKLVHVEKFMDVSKVPFLDIMKVESSSF